MTTKIKGESGYLLLELLAVFAIMVIVAGSMVLQSSSCVDAYYKQQVQCAARQLAASLRLLQQQAMYADSATVFLDTANSSGYYIVDGTYIIKQCSFASMGWSDVYFKERMPSAGFGTDGAPRFSGKYILCHKKLPKYKYLVELQPVTGRVLVYEKK